MFSWVIGCTFIIILTPSLPTSMPHFCFGKTIIVITFFVIHTFFDRSTSTTQTLYFGNIRKFWKQLIKVDTKTNHKSISNQYKLKNHFGHFSYRGCKFIVKFFCKFRYKKKLIKGKGKYYIKITTRQQLWIKIIMVRWWWGCRGGWVFYWWRWPEVIHTHIQYICSKMYTIIL